MKQQLLIAAALLIGTTGFAQGGRKSAAWNKPVKGVQAPTADNNEFPTMGTKRSAGPLRTANHTAAVCTPNMYVTSGPNAFGVGGGVTTYQQNCLSYNKDLNTVLWTQRGSDHWTFPGKTSGAIQATWADVMTLAWDSMIIYRDSAIAWPARYPGGVLFNPVGNTNIANAQMVGSGASTSKTGTPTWLGEWYANRQPTGNYHDPVIPNDVNHDSVGIAPFGYVGNSATNVGFLNIDMCQVGSDVRVSGALFNPGTGEVQGAVIAKGTYSGGNFTWGRDTIAPGFLNTAQGLISDGLGARIAFGPDGLTGYAVFNGRDSVTYNNWADSTMMPIVYKTTDGGQTWNRCTAINGYNWGSKHPEVLKNVGALIGGAHRATPNVQHGIDLAVDAMGTLHYVTTLMAPWKDGAYAGGGFDSLQYSYVYKWDYYYNHPIIWDLMTDGSCWKTLMVDSIQTAYLAGSTSDTTSAYNPWENVAGTSWLAYGGHLTVSRSTDGKVIFYGWGDSDSTVTGTRLNTNPEMMIKAYDVTTSKMSALQNVTSGIGQCYFSYLSDVSYMDNTTNMWVVPYMFTIGRVQGSTAGTFSGTGAVDYFYGNCAAFNSTNINIPVTLNDEVGGLGCAVKIQQHNNYTAHVTAFPNPFSHATTIQVQLNQASAIDLKVFDAIGNLVYSKKTQGNVGENNIVFDGSNLAAGVYHYTLTAENEKVTKKMVIQK